MTNNADAIRRLAEGVMEWELTSNGARWRSIDHKWGDSEYQDYPAIGRTAWNPRKNIAHARMLMVKTLKPRWAWSLESYWVGENEEDAVLWWEASFWGDVEDEIISYTGRSTDIEDAICKAALRLLEG